jgi:hypothetical protein
MRRWQAKLDGGVTLSNLDSAVRVNRDNAPQRFVLSDEAVPPRAHSQLPPAPMRPSQVEAHRDGSAQPAG